MSLDAALVGPLACAMKKTHNARSKSAYHWVGAVRTEGNPPTPMVTAVDAAAKREGEMGVVRFKSLFGRGTRSGGCAGGDCGASRAILGDVLDGDRHA